jgi:hypothetical protein
VKGMVNETKFANPKFRCRSSATFTNGWARSWEFR